MTESKEVATEMHLAPRSVVNKAEAQRIIHDTKKFMARSILRGERKFLIRIPNAHTGEVTTHKVELVDGEYQAGQITPGEIIMTGSSLEEGP